MKKGIVLVLAVWAGVAVAQQPGTPPSASAPPVRPIGVVTQIKTGSLTLQTDAGPELLVPLPDGITVVRVPPGAKDLKAATPITVGEISLGDRVLIRGRISDDQKSVLATSVIVMAKTELEKAREAERAEWRRRGIGGLVKAVSPETKEITIAVPNVPPTPGNLTHPVVVTLQPHAVLLRYAPDSVKFSDAQPSTLEEIKVGDQVRALGMKSEDGGRFAAEKLVSGTFRNLGATVISVDAPSGAVTVKDLATGQPVLVRTNGDSKLHRLPPFLAQMIASFSSGESQPGATPGRSEASGSAGGAAAGTPPGQQQGGGPASWRRDGASPGAAAGGPQPGGPRGQRGNGPSNFQQMLERTPPLALSELKPGDALIVLSTLGAKPTEVTAITVLAGVEPILAAQPKGSTQMELGPWNMSMSEGGP
jgi:hypothetical protein